MDGKPSLPVPTYGLSLWNKSKKMIQHLRAEAATYGLKMHMGKNKVLTNSLPSFLRGNICIGQETVEVVAPSDAEKYLGRKLCATDAMEAELKKLRKSN